MLLGRRLVGGREGCRGRAVAIEKGDREEKWCHLYIMLQKGQRRAKKLLYFFCWSASQSAAVLKV